MTDETRGLRREVVGRARPVALVTGASYGIGAACSETLARDGFDIVVTEIEAADLTETTGSVEAMGAAAEGIALDLRDRQSIRRTVDAALTRFGRIDVLVNNAGRPLLKRALDVSYEEFMDV